MFVNMESMVLYPKNDAQSKLLQKFIESSEISSVKLNDEETRKLAGILLANLAKKNPNAYATDDEILSIVEEVRQDRYGKKN